MNQRQVFATRDNPPGRGWEQAFRAGFGFGPLGRSHHLHLWMPWNAEPSLSLEIQLFFFICQPNVCWAVAGCSCTKHAVVRIGERLVDVRVGLFHSLRTTTGFTSR